MDLWIPITIAAAFSQNLRFMLQKHLRATGLSTAGATFSRLVYAAPLAGSLLGLLIWFGLGQMPQMHTLFWVHAVTGGLAQIGATMLVVAVFTQRNFTVGITFKKTETLQTALFGLVVLGEGLSGNAALAIAVGLIGVLLISDAPAADPSVGWRARFFNRAALYGLGAGALFGVSAVNYRGAMLSLEDAHFVLRSVFTLTCVTTFQTIALGLYMQWREPGEVARVLRHWRVTSLVGLTGMIGSVGWFTAFALQNAAYVKALGQIELVFTFIGSYLIFGERSTKRELLGIALVVVSIILLVL